jgi:hypothetical protein
MSMTPPAPAQGARARVTKKAKKDTPKVAEARLPGFSIMTKDGIDVTNSAGRGTKTKEQREHAHLMRIMKACDSCKKKKIRVGFAISAYHRNGANHVCSAILLIGDRTTICLALHPPQRNRLLPLAPALLLHYLVRPPKLAAGPLSVPRIQSTILYSSLKTTLGTPIWILGNSTLILTSTSTVNP